MNMKQRVGQYLMDAVHHAGVDKIFGVPGDFNLAFLDDIVRHEGVEWVGTTNELNGSYRRWLCTYQWTRRARYYIWCW